MCSPPTSSEKSASVGATTCSIPPSVINAAGGQRNTRLVPAPQLIADPVEDASSSVRANTPPVDQTPNAVSQSPLALPEASTAMVQNMTESPLATTDPNVR